MVLSMMATDPTACDEEPQEVKFKPTLQLLISNYGELMGPA